MFDSRNMDSDPPSCSPGSSLGSQGSCSEKCDLEVHKFDQESRSLSPKSSAKAKFRWDLLSSALSQNNQDECCPIQNEEEHTKNGIAVMKKKKVAQRACFRYPSYNILQVKRISGDDIDESQDMEKDKIWHEITSSFYSKISLKIGLIKPHFSRNDLFGFNNTGNVCVWPSEECLAAVCLENPYLVENKAVIELGCGMTGLAGLIIHQVCEPKLLMLTDGNINSVYNINANLRANGLCKTKEPKFNEQDTPSQHCQDMITSKPVIESSELRWENVEARHLERYDTVLCADCIFFEEFREHLVDCISKVLKPDGRAVLVAPKRGKTLEDFVKIARESRKFEVVKMSEDYARLITDRRSELSQVEDGKFIEDQHYPLLIDLRKKSI